MLRLVAQPDSEVTATDPILTVENGGAPSTGVTLSTRSWLTWMNEGPRMATTSNLFDTAKGQANSRWSVDSLCDRSPVDAVAVRGELMISGLGICAVSTF